VDYILGEEEIIFMNEQAKIGYGPIDNMEFKVTSPIY